MQIGIDTNLQIKEFLAKKGHHHPAMGPVSNSVPPPPCADGRFGRKYASKFIIIAI